MVRVFFPFFRNCLHQIFFNLQNCISGCKSRSIRDPENVSIHRNYRLSESCVQDNICCFASHSRERFQLFSILRNLSCVIFYKLSTGFDYIFRFRWSKSNALDVRQYFFCACLIHLLRCWKFSKQFRSNFIHRNIGSLRTENYRDQQFKRITVAQLSFRFWN